MTALQVAEAYYEAFNQKDYTAMLALVHPDVVHFPNQGGFRRGREKFEEFLRGNDHKYDEQLTDMVFYTEPSGERIAVQFTVNGIYKVADEGMPRAHGQKYTLPVSAFLEIHGGFITKVTTYYNLALWLSLVSR